MSMPRRTAVRDDNGPARPRARLCAELALAAAAALLAACSGHSQTKVSNGPVKTQEKCPIAADDLIPGVTAPTGKLDAFEACVGRYGSGAEQAQAASWIRDWYTATNCLHRCDPKGLGAMAHDSMWKGLRYIAAVTLPAGDNVDAACRTAQRELVVTLDESMSHLAGWSAVSGPQCKSDAKMEATKRKIAEAQSYRDRLTQNISAFTSKQQ